MVTQRWEDCQTALGCDNRSSNTTLKQRRMGNCDWTMRGARLFRNKLGYIFTQTRDLNTVPLS